MDLTFWILMIAGLITGFSKFSVGGMGIIILPILTIAFPGPEAVAILIPLYILTDLMAISSYRTQISWKTLWQILPVTFIGILVGTYLLTQLNSDNFSTVLGVFILLMLAVSIWLDLKEMHFMQRPFIIRSISFLTGIVATIANAGGPLVSILLLEQKLTKESYVATRAWIVMIINAMKLPMMIAIGLMNVEVAKLSLIALPPLIIGSIIGFFTLKAMNPFYLKWLIRIIAGAAAVKLLLF